MKQTTDPAVLSTASCGNVTVQRRDVPINTTEIPDLWHIAQAQREPERSKILSVWHLAHDMRNKLLTMAGEPPQ